MSRPNGYNNPAYCHQFDSSLYDYHYVPEIDPDSPDPSAEPEIRNSQTKLEHPFIANFQKDFSESDEFEGSDESNHSIIIEECNNRRVTLICEKRNKAEINKDEFYEDGNFRGVYYQDISLESENGYDSRSNKAFSDFEEEKNKEKSIRHQRPLEPPLNQDDRIKDYFNSNNNNQTRFRSASNFKPSTTSINNYQRPQRHHRYEEIPSEEDYVDNDSISSSSVHRYAEISSDENGYPTLTKEIKVEQNREQFKNDQNKNCIPKIISKPRAISPVIYTKNFSPPVTPNRTYQKIYNSKDFEFNVSQLSPNAPSPIIYSSSPLKENSFEMSELSPPRQPDNSNCTTNKQSFFIHSPKRQAPINASVVNDPQVYYAPTGRCLLPKNLQQINISGKKNSYSLPNSPKRCKEFTKFASSPSKTHSDKKIAHIFNTRPVKSSQTKSKVDSRGKVFNKKENNPTRRNISNSFSDFPKEYTFSPKIIPRSPYKPTTAEIIQPKTAIITPIFQRKNQQIEEEFDFSFQSRRNFEKTSQAFQSTGNIFKTTIGIDFQPNSPQKLMSPSRIRRNQSVPNFTQKLATENKMITKKAQEIVQQENEKYSRNLEFGYSPKKPLESVSPIDKSKISLIDHTKSSWSNSSSEYQTNCSICFILATIVHLVTATATCGISFYLFSKIGRKYYLDFGLLAGFVNFILGLLGFRSYCWRWLPNRNYVSGFIGLAVFSALTCAGLTYLITARPMAGDPILDVMGGAICAVSVLTIVLALTGLTMSGCCKTPPPDNRVTDI